MDFVVSRGRRSVGIEVQSGSRFSRRDLSALEAFLAATPEAVAGVLAYNGGEAVQLGERLFALPLARLLA